MVSPHFERSELPAGTSSISPSRRSLPPTLLAALPLRLGANTMAPSLRCEAADSSASWVSVSFIGILRSVWTAPGAVTTEARTGWKAGGAGSRESAWVLHKAGNSDALSIGEVQSFLERFIAGS